MSNKYINLVRRMLSNKVIFYLVSRYATYFIQFINSLFIAIYLGPYYLGIWGFINLVLGYISQLNFGIVYSVNVIVSIHKEDEVHVRKIVGNGAFMVLVLSVLVLLFYLLNSLGFMQIGNRYNFNNYIIPILTISVLTHINAYFACIFRVFGKIHAISLNQSLYPVIVLFLIPFFRGEELLWAMLFANSVAFIISFILFVVYSPIKIKPLNEWTIIKYIQAKGWYLFIYNASFYLIILSTNTFISGNYEVKEFGYYTFSYSLANVALLLLNSISFLIFPKMLNRFASSNNEQINTLLMGVRTSYISLSHVLIHFVIMLFPLFIYFFQDYSATSTVFKITALTVVLYTNSFGYVELLMAKGKEKLIAVIAFGALGLNILLSAILVHVFHVSFSYVILATLATYSVYVYVTSVYGRKYLELPVNFCSVFSVVYPWRVMVPFTTSLLFVVFSLPEIFFIVPFVVYLLLNYKDLIEIKNIAKKIIANPNFVNI